MDIGLVLGAGLDDILDDEDCDVYLNFVPFVLKAYKQVFLSRTAHFAFGVYPLVRFFIIVPTTASKTPSRESSND